MKNPEVYMKLFPRRRASTNGRPVCSFAETDRGKTIEGWACQLSLEHESPGMSFDVAKDSQLASDPELANGLTTAYMASRYMRTATECVTVSHVSRGANGGLFGSTAEYVLARTALMASAKAIFILAQEESSARHLNALRLQLLEAGSLLKAAQAISEVDITNDAENPVIQFVEQARVVAREFGINPKSRVSETDIILAASESFDELARIKAKKQLKSYWQRASAVAHACTYTAELNTAHLPLQRQYEEAWVTPLQTLNIARDLWDVRRR